MSAVTPWWETLKLRQEASSGSIDDVQMSLFRSVYSTGAERPPYADPRYYGEITHPSPPLADLMAKVAVRLGGGNRYTAAPALWRLDQSMGGGKSHGLIGLYHLAAHPQELSETDIGGKAFAEAQEIAGQPLAADLGQPQVVVLACDNMTAGKGNPDIDGVATTLHERFLWRLFSGDLALYKRYQPFHADKSKIIDALTAVGRPVLILVDEILDYIRQLSESSNSDLAVRDMAFLRALLDAVNDVPHVAMVIVMIASEDDSIALDASGQQRRAELDDLLIRNGKPATVTANTDFAAILRRRLFEGKAATEVLNATSDLFARAMAGIWTDKVFATIPTSSSRSFAEEVARCYPFHPALMAMAEQEWAKLAGFQKVRSTIQIFAATAYVLSQRKRQGEWVPYLIGVGDLPLSSTPVREAVIGSGLISDSKTQANYRQIASTDIVSIDDSGGAARILDLRRAKALFSLTNPRAAERAATALFLCSIVGTRSQGKQGATEAELKAATFVPEATFALADADAIIAELKDMEAGGLAAVEVIAGKGGLPARLFLSTRNTLNMLWNSTKVAVSDHDRDEELAKAAERLITSGAFKKTVFVPVDTPEHDARTSREAIEAVGIDDARTTRLVVLDPRRFSLLNGGDEDTRATIRAAMGLGAEKMPVLWASSAVFAIINSTRRRHARGVVTTQVAWLRVSEMNEVRNDPELLEKATGELAEAKRNVEKAVRRAYQHVAFLAVAPDGGRVEQTLTFEHENQSALNGTSVWKALVEAAKAFDVDAFDAKALVFNLTDADYNKPLDEVRDLFWNSPRLPLLPNGDTDLKRAIFEAVRSGQLRLVGADGIDRHVSTADEIGIGQASLRLAKPLPPVVAGDDPDDKDKGGGTDGPGVPPPKPPGGGGVITTPAESELSFTLMVSLSSDEQRENIYRVLSAVAAAVDEGRVSYSKASMSLIVNSAVGADISELLKKAGITASIKAR
jgi:hypothetical protein